MEIERHHDVVGFSSRGNFINIAMKIYLSHETFFYPVYRPTIDSIPSCLTHPIVS